MSCTRRSSAATIPVNLAITIIASIVVPSIPVARRIGDAKDDALAKLDEQIQAEFQRTLQSPAGGSTADGLGTLQSLLQLRERIEYVNAWPFKTKSLMAAISVITVSAFPVVLQLLLERMTK